MKKLMFVALAASLAGGAVLAQPAEGNTTAPRTPPRMEHPEQGGYIYGNSGWTPEQVWGGHQNYPIYQGRPQRPWAPVLPQVRPSRGDRDGDGVRDRNDRYPDDPRYR